MKHPLPQGKQAKATEEYQLEKEEGDRRGEKSLETEKTCIWVTQTLAAQPLGDRCPEPHK